jgi:transposase
LGVKYLQEYYKDHLSDFNICDQNSHAQEYILYSKNSSYDLPIDETTLTQGELYMILTSKKAHGRKKSIVAIIKRAKAEDIISIIKKIPQESRNLVKEVTLDITGSMHKIVKRCLPKAIQTIDRFHVHKLI